MDELQRNGRTGRPVEERVAKVESQGEAAEAIAADGSDSEKGRVLDDGRVSVSCAAVTAAVLPSNGSSRALIPPMRQAFASRIAERVGAAK